MMLKKAKKFWVSVLAASVLVGVTGCGSSSSENVSNESGQSISEESRSGEDTVSVASGKKGILEFWTVFTGADGVNMQAMVDAYNATNPDYTVNHRAMEANDLYLKLPLAIQSGQDVPDIAINHVERISLFQENGFLTDLTGLMPASQVEATNYNTTVWEMTDIDGGHYGIPLDYCAMVTYVNMDLYEQYGNGALDDGVLTWDEIKLSGEATKADGIIDIGIGWQRANWLSSYGQLGGQMTENGQDVKITDENAVKVLHLWGELFNAGYTQQEGDDAWAMFLGGNMLYCPDGIWTMNNAVESGVPYKMVEYPVWDENTRGSWTSSHNMVVPKDDSRSEEETKAAMDFMNWIGSNSLEWAKAGQVPAHLSILDSAEFKEMPQYILTQDTSRLKMYDYKYYGYAVESLDKIFPEVFFGRMTPEDGLKQAEQETKDRISTEG